MNLLDSLKRICSGIFSSVKELITKTAGGTRANRKFLFIGIGAMGILLTLCIVIIARGFISGPAAGTGFRSSGDAAETRLIPPEDLFLPDEPEFTPEFIPEREQRTVWTTADAEPYWIDPLSEGSEKYINTVDTTINNLMERVP